MPESSHRRESHPYLRNEHFWMLFANWNLVYVKVRNHGFLLLLLLLFAQSVAKFWDFSIVVVVGLCLARSRVQSRGMAAGSMNC